jgi:hypothetical protein
MLPYGGTPIRDRLEREGRLRGDLTHPDYVFLDPRINEYHQLLNQTVRPWIHHEGLTYQLNYALDELETVRRLVPGVQGIDDYQMALQVQTRESNERLFRLVEETSMAFEAGDRSRFDPVGVSDYCEKNVNRLVATRNSFIAENIYLLRDASNVDCTNGPVSGDGAADTLTRSLAGMRRKPNARDPTKSSPLFVLAPAGPILPSSA